MKNDFAKAKITEAEIENAGQYFLGFSPYEGIIRYEIYFDDEDLTDEDNDAGCFVYFIYYKTGEFNSLGQELHRRNIEVDFASSWSIEGREKAIEIALKKHKEDGTEKLYVLL